MTVTTISFLLPLLWALFAGISWRFMWKEPINNWIICLIIGAACFFWFAITFIGYLIALAIRFKVFSSLMNKKDDEQGK